MAHDVFISYASQDKAVADAVCATLEADRIRCWIAPRDILPGTPYTEALTDALRSSRVLVLVLSGNSNGSHHVMREVEAAVDVGIPVVPFKIAETTLSLSMKYLLKSIHWLDAMTPPMERHIRTLADVIRSLLERSGPVKSAASRGTNPAMYLPPNARHQVLEAGTPGRRPPPRRRWVAPLVLVGLGVPLGLLGWWHLQNANTSDPLPPPQEQRVSNMPIRPMASSAAEPVINKDTATSKKDTAVEKAATDSKAANKRSTTGPEPGASVQPDSRRRGPPPFIPIFNGKDLTGWEPFPGGTAKWSVEDGAIVGRDGRGMLFSKRGDFADFHVRAEVKVASGGNSGLFFRMPFTNVTKSGYEAQIEAGNDPYPTGSLYGIAAAPKDLAAAGEWFTLEVTAHSGHLRVLINGKVAVNSTESEPRTLRGHFALQQQVPNREICFRKIEVREFK
jgi:hypothetical protein